MKIKKIIFVFFISICVFIGLVSDGLGDQVVIDKKRVNQEPASNNSIVFGQSASLDGAFGLYGNIIQKAIQARMNHVNDSGGVHGKMLKLVSVNDAGDPRKTEENVERLLKDGIDMFIGNMGTRSVLKLLPLIKTEKIALFFPWSGDQQFRDPKLTHIINGPGLLKPQLTAIVDYIEKNIKLKKIAIFHADDDFSTDASNELTKELVAHDIKPVAIASYNRFTLDIAGAVKRLIESDPKIVICLSTSMPVVKLINNFFTQGHYGVTFFGIDSTLFVGDIVQARGADFYYSSAVPDPKTSQMLLAKQYLEDMKKYFPEEIPNILAFSYYVSTAIIIDAIKNISGTITKEKIIKAIENMKQHMIDGFMVNFDETNRHAFGREISIIKG
ncbi:MAG: ABC transporter substrate-binding protein [bacterium]